MAIGTIRNQEECLMEANVQAQNLINQLSDAKNTIVQTQQQLVQTAKMASVGTLSSGIAHELNNPLMAITGFSQLIEKESKENEKLIKYSKKVLNAAHRMKDVINSLRSFDQQAQKENWLKADLIKIAEEFVAPLASQYEHRKVKFNLDTHPLNCEMTGNREQLISVFQNLLSNAIDSFEDIKDDRVKEINIIIKEEPSDTISLTFEDNAAGMDKATCSSVFQPFFTTKPAGQGTGLGMYLCYNVVQSHQGEMKIESKLNQGTKVTVTFNTKSQADKEAVKSAKTSAPILTASHQVSGGKAQPSLLIIDDEDEVLEILESYVEDDYNTSCFSDPKEALQEIRQKRFDLIISDLKMPELSGLDIIDEAKKSQPDTPVLILTGFDRGDPEVTEALDHGAKDIIGKPVTDIDQFLSTLENALAKKSE